MSGRQSIVSCPGTRPERAGRRKLAVGGGGGYYGRKFRRDGADTHSIRSEPVAEAIARPLDVEGDSGQVVTDGAVADGLGVAIEEGGVYSCAVAGDGSGVARGEVAGVLGARKLQTPVPGFSRQLSGLGSAGLATAAASAKAWRARQTPRRAKVRSSKQWHWRVISAVSRMTLKGAKKTSVRSRGTVSGGMGTTVSLVDTVGFKDWFLAVLDMFTYYAQTLVV